LISNLLTKAFIQLEDTTPYYVAKSFLDAMLAHDDLPNDFDKRSNSSKDGDREDIDDSSIKYS
jgi:hypothetical protein